MHRNDLIHQLESYRDRWAQETETCDRFLAFVRGHADCFERSLLEGHVTGSAWLVNGASTHVLLTHHRKLEQWFQLGGHADGESDVARVAMTEAVEESGLADLAFVADDVFDIDIHPIPERKGVPEHFHYDVRFAIQATRGEAFVVSEESLDLAWVAIDRLADYTSEASMLRMAKKWRSNRTS